MFHLFTHDQEMGQEQLVEQLDVSKPAISRTLNSLVSKGYVTRQRDPDDKRAYRIQLTRQALEIRPAVEQVYSHLFAWAVQDISPDELACFLKLLSRMSQNMAHRSQKEPRQEPGDA